MTGKTTLYYGANGDEVKELQQYLNKNGYNLDVDGGFGDKTLSAVRDYQQKNGLTVDGIVGSNTWESLLTFTAPTLNSTSYTDTTEGNTNKTAMDTALNALNSYGSHTWENQAINDTLLGKYLNRAPFSYDLNGDALYQQYKDKYIQQGKMAMQDTIGQASAMTGGYGNSYAQSVGQQAYQNSLDNLNDIVPELYQMAYDRYNQQGQDMLNQLSVLDADYNRSYGEWETGYNVAKDKYGIASDNFYNAANLYGSELDRANSISQQDWQNAMTIYNAKAQPSNTGNNGGNTNSSGNNGNNGNNDNNDNNDNDDKEGSYYETCLTDLKKMKATGKSNKEAMEYLSDMQKAGYLTMSEYSSLYNKYRDNRL